MSITTSATRSLSHRQPSRQGQNSTEITTTRQRCQYRMQVVYDSRLSPGARLLYMALDDHARDEGYCWPHQKTLAKDLGVDESTIKRWVAELTTIGCLAAGRSRPRRANGYALGWKGSKMSPCGGPEGLKNEPLKGSEMSRPYSLYEPGKGTGLLSTYRNEEEPGNSPVCRCGGSGSFLYEDVKSNGAVVRKRVQCACTSVP